MEAYRGQTDRESDPKTAATQRDPADAFGAEVVEALCRAGALVPTILVTGRLDPGIAQRAAQLGVAVMEKPLSATRLVELISAKQDGR